MKSKRLIAFFRFFYDFLEICIRNILHLAFIEHRHQCHNNPFQRNPLDIIGQDASPTALPFPFRSNCHPDFIDALPKRSALERVFLQKRHSTFFKPKIHITHWVRAIWQQCRLDVDWM